MKIEIISEEALSEEDLKILRLHRGIITRRKVISLSFIGTIGLPFLSKTIIRQADAQGLLTLARYMFAAFTVDGAVKLSSEARAWSTLVNEGKKSEPQPLTATVQDEDGSIEDEATIAVKIPPKSKQTFIVTCTPTDLGKKLYSCKTNDDKRSKPFVVIRP